MPRNEQDNTRRVEIATLLTEAHEKIRVAIRLATAERPFPVSYLGQLVEALMTVEAITPPPRSSPTMACAGTEYAVAARVARNHNG